MFAKPKTNVCPFLKAECIEASCAMWVTISGTHPQTKAALNMPDCTLRWLPTLLIENTKASIETGAAVESFRNEMVRGNDAVALALVENSARMIA